MTATPITAAGHGARWIDPALLPLADETRPRRDYRPGWLTPFSKHGTPQGRERLRCYCEPCAAAYRATMHSVDKAA